MMSTSALAADVFAIDNGHSTIMFKVNHLGVSDAWGRFNKIDGTFIIDGENPANSEIKVRVMADSVDSNSAKRDEHLRNADFFNAGQFPVITFKSTAVEKKGDQWMVTGDFSLHGVTKSITVPFEKVGEGDDPWGNYRMGANARFDIQRSDYGMDYMLDGLGDSVTLIVSLEGIKK
jgi:polyisoprenoid-binding protein YceI